MLPFENFPMEESRVLAVTILTTITWLVVTFLTTNKSAEVRLKMMPVLQSRKLFVQRLLFSIALGIIFLVIVVSFWGLVLNEVVPI
jgi:hypothetical protein